MTVYHENDIRRLTWFGLRPLLARAATLPGLNHALVAAAKRFPSSRFAKHVPVARKYARLILTNGQAILMAKPSRCHIARELYLNDGALASSADRGVIALVQVLVADCDVFLDVGAYSGMFSLVAAAANSDLKAFAFEILPENHAVLHANILLNDLATRVEARLEGLSDRNGTMRAPRSSGSWVLPSSISLGSQFSEGVDVPVTTLDDRMAGFVGRAAMKIDVEGFEPQVIAGGRAFIERVRPAIICELLPNASGTDAIQAQLEPLGYEFYQFTSAGLQRRTTLTPSRDGRDWLLLHQAQRDQLPSQH